MNSFRKILTVMIIAAIAFTSQVMANGQGEEAGASDSAKPIEIIFAHSGMGAGTPAQVYAEMFKEFAEEYSNGELKIEIFGESQLGGEQQLTQAQQLGTVQIAWAAINNLTPRVPRLSFFNLPYLMGSFEEAYMVQDKIIEHAQNWTVKQAGVRLIGWEAMGFRALFNTERPIYHPEDMKGLIWRVPKDDVLISNYEAWGVSPQPLAWHELFNALSQGVVNGGGNPYDDIVTNNLWEPAPYITPLHYNLLCHAVTIAEPFYQSLSDEHKDVIDRAGQAATEKLRVHMENAEKGRIEELKSKAKVRINEPVDESEFSDLVMKNWPRFYKLIGGGDAKIGEQLVTEIQEIAKGKREKLSDNLLF